MRRKKLLGILVVLCIAFGVTVYSTVAQVASNGPPDSVMIVQRNQEYAGGRGFTVEPPTVPLRPVERQNRERFGAVGPAPLTLADLDNLVFPSATTAQKMSLLEGLDLFTRVHTPEEGLGPVFADTRCLQCHLSGDDAPRGLGLIEANSHVARASRSTPTNFRFGTGIFTADGRITGTFNDNRDALTNTGDTAAFTNFGDYSPSTGVFDPLNGTVNPVTGFSQNFGGFVQHRFAIPGCVPDALPPLVEDLNLLGIDPETGYSNLGFKRSVGEFAGPPYIGRGLIEAVPNVDVAARVDLSDTQRIASSLNDPTVFECTGDCVQGRINQIAVTPNFVGGMGRFGLRANGVEIFQFAVGGANGGLSLTSLLDINEQPLQAANRTNPQCQDRIADPELPLFQIFSERNLIRMTPPPEFGQPLLTVLNSTNPSAPLPAGTLAASVQRGAQLFGVDLTAFANRMIPGRMPAGGDGRDPNAINQQDSMVSCVACHIPVQRTGRSPALGSDIEIVSAHLSNVWAPIFSDLLIHEVPSIQVEQDASIPRTPVVIRRPDDGALYDTFDIPRNLAQDVFQNQNPTVQITAGNQAPVRGNEFRTAPLMGLGKTGQPMIHDARVYLSRFTLNTTPAGTVFSNSEVTNAPLVVRTVDDVIRAAIELHDLPAPDDVRTPTVQGAGCPVPPVGTVVNVSYGPNPASVICPPYNSRVSDEHRSDAREVIRRFRSLTPNDQQAMIDFLKQL